MRNLILVRYELVVCVVGVILASCNSGGSQSSVPSPTRFNPAQGKTLQTGSVIARESGGRQLRYNSLRHSSVTERLVHSFALHGDGHFPETALLDVNGTTVYGGLYPEEAGTVFKITRSGKETVLQNFDNTDGAYPLAKLIKVNGTLYGTTSGGGTSSGGSGAVYKITQSGKLTTLHKFTRRYDGAGPQGALTNVNGTLYGTTNLGGTYNLGTVFSITTTGHETALHSFAGGSDGDGPQAGLISINGFLYGTTSGGGSSGDGTVFSVTTSGSEKVLHSFSGPPDGDFPIAGLTNVDGTIYGTTDDGGFSKTCYPSSGCGTVFSMDASGNEKVLYSFGGPPDGAGPMANLLNVNGTLYGTTQSGGAY